MSVRGDLDKIWEWVLGRPPWVLVSLYVFTGINLGICLVFAFWGVPALRLFGMVNGILLLMVFIDYTRYRKRRPSRPAQKADSATSDGRGDTNVLDAEEDQAAPGGRGPEW